MYKAILSLRSVMIALRGEFIPDNLWASYLKYFFCYCGLRYDNNDRIIYYNIYNCVYLWHIFNWLQKEEEVLNSIVIILCIY